MVVQSFRLVPDCVQHAPSAVGPGPAGDNVIRRFRSEQSFKQDMRPVLSRDRGATGRPRKCLVDRAGPEPGPAVDAEDKGRKPSLLADHPRKFLIARSPELGVGIVGVRSGQECTVTAVTTRVGEFEAADECEVVP